jgi:GcvH upstream region-like protein
MMKFLRKHQRLLFMIIAVMTIASFSFFGTFGTFISDDRAPDREIAKAVDGSPIMEREVQAMVRFFSFGSSTAIEHDFLSTGMGTILAERYFDKIKSDFEPRLEKTKRYQPYRHPQAPFISAEGAWKQFLPQMNDHLGRVKQGDLSPETFSAYIALYLDQTAFTPELLQRVLSYQQKQYQGVQPDPAIEPSRLALFGFHSLEDWFGPTYLELLSVFLINTSKIAEERDYSISNEEARADLLQNSLQTLQSLSNKKELTFADAEEFLGHQLKISGIEPAMGVKIWKKVMLFRRLFDDIGSAVFVDPLTYEQFAVFAGESANLELYELPAHLRLQDFRSLLKLQFYLDAVAAKSRGLKLPTSFLSPQEVERKYPELVQSRFSLEVAKVSKEEIAQKVTLKETWDWEISDHGWEVLKKEFPILGKSELDGRFKILEDLEADFRLKVDRFARRQIVDTHPEWLEESFEKTPMEKVSVGIRSKGAAAPFTDIEDPTQLLAFLMKNDQGTFTPNQESFYRITVLERPTKKSVMSFEEALQDDLLEALLEKKLKAEKDESGRQYYADLLKMISAEELDENAYARQRFVPVMEEARKSIQEMGDASPFLKATGDPMRDQWLLTKRLVDVKRSNLTPFSKEEAFSLKVQNWSEVHPGSDGAITFFRLLERKEQSDSIAEEIDLGQKILGMDARRLLMNQLLDRMEAK